ncbi:LOW QUALITY PROTEIN: hypothetical protein CRUP_005450 [Coryphaenoides rupestris]|nr:LOW QUALITY PROTEIN: hypothetical protein CRUP_005450 [Coryphaenoides rupestris]
MANYKEVTLRYCSTPSRLPRDTAAPPPGYPEILQHPLQVTPRYCSTPSRVLGDAGSSQRRPVLLQHYSHALHKPLGEWEQWEANVRVAAPLRQEAALFLRFFGRTAGWLPGPDEPTAAAATPTGAEPNSAASLTTGGAVVVVIVVVTGGPVLAAGGGLAERAPSQSELRLSPCWEVAVVEGLSPESSSSSSTMQQPSSSSSSSSTTLWLGLLGSAVTAAGPSLECVAARAEALEGGPRSTPSWSSSQASRRCTSRQPLEAKCSWISWLNTSTGCCSSWVMDCTILISDISL